MSDRLSQCVTSSARNRKVAQRLALASRVDDCSTGLRQAMMTMLRNVRAAVATAALVSRTTTMITTTRTTTRTTNSRTQVMRMILAPKTEKTASREMTTRDSALHGSSVYYITSSNCLCLDTCASLCDRPESEFCGLRSCTSLG